MLPSFKQDFWALAREQVGYYSWVQRERYSLARAIGRGRRHCMGCCDDPEPYELVQSLFADGLGFHPMLDIVFSAVARAESRFSLRFVPQRSNEERLTGNLISEIEAAFFLVRNTFTEMAIQRYGEAREIDFVYYDLSRGGKIEKQTGADLGIILSIDLPDLPPLVRYAAFQAKKLDGSSSIPKIQFDTLLNQFGDAAAYLFYDMGRNSLLPPFVVQADRILNKKNEKSDTDSFTLSQSEVENGLPLSLWLISRLVRGQVGISASNFASALNTFTSSNFDLREFSNGRLAIMSIGKPLIVQRDPEAGLNITQ